MKIKNSTLIKINVSTLILTCTITNNALAGDNYLYNQTGSQLGIQSSGAVAGIPEPGTLFYNPAGLSDLTERSSSLDILVYNPHLTFKNQGSVDAGGAPLKGNNGGQGGISALVPNLFVATPLDSHWSVGLGTFTPFGMGVHYKDGWVGRYVVNKATFGTMNANPSVSYKFNDNFAIGGGVSAEFVEVKLKSKVDFGAIGAAFSIPGAIPQTADGSSTFYGHNWGYGANIGAILKLNHETRFGLAFRSGITHKIKHARVTFRKSALGQAISAATGKFNNTKGKMRMKLPGSIIFGFAHDLTKELTLRGDLTFMNWKRFKELRVVFKNPLQPDNVTPNGYRNSFIYTLGMSYKLNQDLVLEGALGYDQTPVKKHALNPIHPDASKFNVSCGAIYDFNEKTRISFGYLHGFVMNRKMNLTSQFAGTLKGKSKLNMNIFGAQMLIKF